LGGQFCQKLKITVFLNFSGILMICLNFEIIQIKIMAAALLVKKWKKFNIFDEKEFEIIIAG